MTYYFHEIPESRDLSYDPPTVTTQWVCEGLFSEKDVGILANSATPNSYLHPLGATLRRQNISVKEFGHKLFNVSVPYARRVRTIGSYSIRSSTIGGTIRIKAGIHVATYPSGKPTHGGLIGVKGDDVEGAEIVIPATKITVAFTHPGNYLTDAKVREISRLVGAVDNSGIVGYEPYEMLLIGCDFGQSGDVTTAGTETSEDISYEFAMSPNLANFAIGAVTGISKKGWDVASVYWVPTVESSKPSQVVDSVDIIRVYRELNLKALLGFG